MYIAAGAPDEYLPPGDDGTTPSLLLKFTISAYGGTFVIDTTCVTPGNYLAFVDTDTLYNSIKPGFGAGTITIGGCDCPCVGNPQCGDAVTNVLDVAKTVNVAFRGADPVRDPGCERDRTNVNLDEVTNVLDVIKVVNVAFRGQSPCEAFRFRCDP
jgi:hypothetical protein